jgi:hypothetical protein
VLAVLFGKKSCESSSVSPRARRFGASQLRVELPLQGLHVAPGIGKDCTA